MAKYRLVGMVGVALVAAFAVGGSLLTDALASHSNNVDVRVTARGTADGTGRVEFAIQQRLPGGTWSERKTGSARFMTPALIAAGTWKNATPVQVEIPADHGVAAPTPAPTGGDGSRRSRPIAYGERFQAGIVDMQIVAVDTDAWPEVQAENQFNNPPPDGKRFVLWTLEASNRRGSFDDSIWITERDFVLVGSRGVQYEHHDEGVDCGITPDPLDDWLYLDGHGRGRCALLSRSTRSGLGLLSVFSLLTPTEVTVRRYGSTLCRRGTFRQCCGD